MADFFEFKEISKKSKASQKEIDKLVKDIKIGRWESTKKKLNLKIVNSRKGKGISKL